MYECIECHKRPIINKKRQLCSTCYQRLRKENGPFLKPQLNSAIKAGPTVLAYENEGEIQFVKNFFQHSNWKHHPVTFRLQHNGNNIRYSPDFYDGNRNVFIEVLRTRQRYHQAKEKYDLFRETFPMLNFEIRHPSGKIFDPKNPKWE